MDMDLNKGTPLKQKQSFEIQQLWVPTTPARAAFARSQGSQPTGPSCLEPTVMLTNCQSRSSSPSDIPNLLRESHHVAMVASPGHASTGSIVMLQAPPTSSGDVNSLDRWSPSMFGNLDAACNVIATSKTPHCPPLLVQIGSHQEMPSSQNMFLLEGKTIFAANSSTSICFCCSSHKAEYRLPGTFIPDCDSLPESSLGVSRNVALSAPSTPATTEKLNKRVLNKKPCSEVNELVEEVERGKCLMAKEISSYHLELERLNRKDASVLDEETSDHLTGVEIISTERESVGINLNLTPKKRLQRKKHRPKVFKEGKTSRTPNPATPLSDMDEKSRRKDITCKRKYVRRNKDVAHSLEKENTSCKRKYVRRHKDVNHSSNTVTNTPGEVFVTESKRKDKSPRRCLNFDLEEPQALDEFSVARSVFKNTPGVHDQDICDVFAMRNLRRKKAVDSTIVQDQIPVKPPIGTASDPNNSTYYSHSECLQQFFVPSSEVSKNICILDKQIPSSKSSVKHLKSVSKEATSYDLAPHKSSSGVSLENLNPCRISDAPSKGTKRCHLSTDEVEVLDHKRTTYSYNLRGCSSKHCKDERQDSFLFGIQKTRKIEEECQSESNQYFSCYNTSTTWKKKQLANNSLDFTFMDEQRFIAQEKVGTSKCILSLEQIEDKVLKHPSLDSEQVYLSSTRSCSRKLTPVKQSRKKNNDILQPLTPEKLSKFRENDICGNQVLEASKDLYKESKQPQDHPLYIMPSCTRHYYVEELEEDPDGVSLAHKSEEAGFLDAGVLRGKNLNPGTISVDSQTTSYFDISASKSFSPGTLVPFIDLMDHIVQKLRHLRISKCHQIGSSHRQNAVVPYGRHEFMMVPYDRNFELTKKRRPRAKVDLDPESNRVWKLLMGKDCIKGEEQSDVDKETWWDEERRVFQGRVDSFIARMHLVQGDRRFSQWKGSVVDSVVGVFLTQNVSDHLSSSAFMSLAANFPLRSHGKHSIPKIENVSTIMEIQNRCILSQIDSHKLQRNLSGSGSFQSSLEISVSQNEDRRENSNCSETLASITGSSITYYSRQKGKGKGSGLCKKEVILCQESTFSGSGINLTGTDDIMSSNVISHNSVFSSQLSIGFNPNLNFEAVDLLSGSMINASDSSSFTGLLQMAERSGSREAYSHVGGVVSETQNQESILNIQNNSSDMCQLDNSKDTFQSCNGDSILKHAALSLSDVLFLTKANPSDDLFSLKIMVEDANISNEKIRSQLLPISCEINSGKYFLSRMCGESEGSVTEPTGPNKLASFSPATSTGSIGKKAVQHITLSEMEVRANLPTLSHKNNAEDAIDASKNENPHVCTSLDTEVLEGFQQEDEISIFKSKQTHDAVQSLDRPCSNQQATVLNNKTAHNSVMSNKFGSNPKAETCSFLEISPETPNSAMKTRKTRPEEVGTSTYDWESLRKDVCCSKPAQERSSSTMDSLDWEAVRTADVDKIAETIRERGMNNVLAERIKEFLNRLVREHGSIDLEWLRDVPPDKVKDYLLSIRGLGLKSAECVRLLTLQQLAFPVDTNVGRICVRLGWVPLQPLPESLQLHLLELYPVLATIQKYLWPRLCKLDQRTLYELHYQMITFGKVFCTKSRPNCNSCPMRGDCRHFASAFASARLALPAPEEKSIVSLTTPIASEKIHALFVNTRPFPHIEGSSYSQKCTFQNNCVPIIEEPASPEPESQKIMESTIEDAFYEDPDGIPSINLNFEEFTQNLQNYMEENMVLQDGSMSKALVALTPEAASIPMPKLKNVSRLRTEHHVYEIPDAHPLLEGLDPREPDDPSPYLLAIWTPDETGQSTEPPSARCNLQDVDQPCESTWFACNSIQEAEPHEVRGTFLIPCRTAMRGSFPLNGTYFQVNEVFADHHSSCDPIHVPRDWIWNLPRRTVFFGTSIPTIFRGLTTEEIQQCFWRGFVCVRGFDRLSRAPKPLYARLHFPASKATKRKSAGEPKVEK